MGLCLLIKYNVRRHTQSTKQPFRTARADDTTSESERNYKAHLCDNLNKRCKRMKLKMRRLKGGKAGKGLKIGAGTEGLSAVDSL
jgi:hypothetical protein